MMRVQIQFSAVLTALMAACSPPEVVPGSSAPLMMRLEPAAPTANDALTVVAEGNPDIQWWTNDEPAPAFDGMLELPVGTLSRGQTWTAVATPEQGEPATASVQVVNAAPQVVVSVQSTAAPGEEILATATAFDADGDELATVWTWTRDGRQVPQLDDRVPASLTVKGEVWEVEVAVRDDRVLSAPSSASVQIGNTAPVAQAVRLSPDEPTVDAVIVAHAEGIDADGDPLQWTWRWLVDGQEIAETGAALPAHTLQRGQQVEVHATLSDGEITANTVVSTPVTVVNGPPSVADVRIEPATPTAADTLTCLAGAVTDADDDAVELITTWVVDGRVIAGSTLAPGTPRGTDVRCNITASDGIDLSDEESATTTIVNAPPSLAPVALNPDTPTAATAIALQGGSPSDPDGDPVDVQVRWTVDGQFAGTGDVLPQGSARRGQQVRAELTPYDGMVQGTPMVASTQLGNASPEVGALTLPAQIRAADAIPATAESSDADGDTLTWTWTFEVDGRVIQQGPSPVLEAGQHVGGQQVQVSGIADDGHGGQATASALATVLNTAPTAPAARIEPEAVAQRTDILCALELPAEDADGDAITYEAAWEVDGQPASGDTTHWPGDTIRAAQLQAGQRWSCTLTASDGEADTASAAVETLAVDADSARQLALGEAHSCALDHQDEVHCWGDDRFGQATAPSGAWSQVVAGVSYACGLDLDGAVSCWGDTVGDAPTGVWAELAAGDAHVCAADPSGMVACWGSNFFGQLQAPALPLHGLVAGTVHTCGLDDGGEIHCWGANFNGVAQPPAGSYASLASGPAHLCALSETGEPACWGAWPNPLGPGPFQALDLSLDTTCGIRDDGSILCGGGSAALTDTPEGSFVSIALGDVHACALTESNATICWGEGADGQTAPPASDLETIAVGGEHTCALSLDGQLRCWGTNGLGQTAAPSGTWRQVASGLEFSCAMDDQGILDCWGDDSCLQASSPAGAWSDFDLGRRHGCALDATDHITCWGHDDQGQAQSPTGTFTAVGTGGAHSCGIRTDGTVHCWGQDLGTPPAGSFVGLAAGAEHTCALTDDGALTCWGQAPSAQNVPAMTFTSVAAGDGLTCALDTAGLPTCWGRNGWGQSEPPAVALRTLDVQGDYACGIGEDDREHCWGRLRR